jgi:2-polyprenyl-6-methoxyphenol hydroxylase-like FAD-dependent oxidoreductase
MSLPGSVDVLVIGAGPAGTTSAALLHRAGYRVAVVERETFPRFVIGESLLPRCMDLLGACGLLPAVEARGYIVKRGALFLRGGERCDFDFSTQFTQGWNWTWQVPREDFDTTLATAVASMGVPIGWRHEVVSVEMPAEGYDPSSDAPGPVTVVRGPDGETFEIRSRWVIDASGYGRVLPRLLGLDAPSGQQLRRAVFTHIRGDRRPTGPEEGRIWVCIHPDGAWVWIIPFSDGRTSVGVVAPEAFWADKPADLDTALREALAGEPNAAARLTEMQPQWPARVLRGYSATVSRMHGPGFHMVGNATEFLDPVFSSGVTLALESANRGANVLLRALAGERVDWSDDFDGYMKRGVDVFRTYVNGWYDGSLQKIFFAPSANPEFKQMICSVLAGYVWDDDNPFVRSHDRRVAQVVRMVERAAAAPA